MEKIIVKNFGPIKEFDVEIKRFTVFIGTQGSGKSTISKLLTICRDLYWRAVVAMNDNPLHIFRLYGIDTYFKPTTYIEYKDGDLTIKYSKGKFTGEMQGYTVKEYRRIQKELFVSSAESMLHTMGFENLDDIKGNIAESRILFANIKTLMYIPAERIMAGQLSSALASLVVAKVPFLNAELQNRDNEKYIKVTSGTKSEIVPLSVCSSGLQSVFPMLMVIDYCVKNNYFDAFVIEEPELNLYPTNQRELLHFVLQRYNNVNKEGGINVILTTHSPYTLSILNVALMASIVAEDKDFTKEVNDIVPKNEQLNPNDLAVYALSEDDQLCCKNLVDIKTQLIGMNSLDAVSDIIGSDFRKLQQLYLKHLKK